MSLPTITPRRAAAVALVVVALVMAVLATVNARTSSQQESARSDALAAAQQRLPLLLSYDQATLADDLDRAVDQTTGGFGKDYRAILDEVVAPTAAEQKISTKAVVSAAGVVSGDADRVVVLAFLTQTTSTGGKETSVSGSRVEVTMTRAGSHWKIAGLEPL